MSALPPKADIRQREWYVRYVPIADIAQQAASVAAGPVGALSALFFLVDAPEALADWQYTPSVRYGYGDGSCWQWTPRWLHSALLLRLDR
jgi:hypothetical protein